MFPIDRPRPEQPPRAIALVAAARRHDAVAAARLAAEWLRERGPRVTLVEVERPDQLPVDLFADVDLALVLGGDGTVVATARAAGAWGVPVIGVNYGTFGFLTEIGPDDLEAGLAAVCAGSYEVESRLMLTARLDGGDSYLAANDVAVRGTDPGRTLELRVSAQAAVLAEFPADGLLVATPTGSTAYNFSAGGPVLVPTLPALVLTPICPHTLTVRPLVLDAGTALTIEVIAAPRMSHSAVVSIDGQRNLELLPGVPLTVARADTCLWLARLTPRAFFDSLRDKLGWGRSRC